MEKNVLSKKFTVILAVCLAILISPIYSHAQEHITLSSLEVNLWPEFDQPAMLVIYFATLSPEVTLPVEVTLRMPAHVDTPNAVANGPTTGAVGDIFYTRQMTGQGTFITFTATMPVIQFEYYDPDLIKPGGQRHYQYIWPGDYAVESFSMRVQQPIGATDFRISPAISTEFQGGDGLVYHNLDVGSLQPSDTFQISLDYTKQTDTLTYESFQIQPSGPIPSDPSSALPLQYLPWVLGFLGIVLITAAGLWYWQSSRSAVTEPTRKRHKPIRKDVDEVTESISIYCSQCGKRAHTGDRFCRSCGSRLRKE